MRTVPTRTWATAVVGVAIAAVLVGQRLLGVGATAVHDPSVVAPTITVCDRQYHRGAGVVSIAEIAAQGIEPVLVDPAPLARCTGHDPGSHPCTRDPDAGPCATVVFVRIGDDAYVSYALAGGP